MRKTRRDPTRAELRLKKIQRNQRTFCMRDAFNRSHQVQTHRLKLKSRCDEAAEALTPHTFAAVCAYYDRHINDRHFGPPTLEQSAKHRILFVRVCAHVPPFCQCKWRLDSSVSPSSSSSSSLPSAHIHARTSVLPSALNAVNCNVANTMLMSLLTKTVPGRGKFSRRSCLRESNREGDREILSAVS